MPRISKKTLLEDVMGALRGAGWDVAKLSKESEHPMRLRMRRGSAEITLRVYIWTVSHGGGERRPSHEHRIQITSGVGQFQVEEGERTLVLGWSARFGVYAAFDVRRHTGPLGSSPSMQIGQAALVRAGEVGVAMHMRGREEVAIAVRPELLGDYAERIDMLHNKTMAPRQLGELRRAFAASPDVDLHALTEAKRALTALDAGAKPRFGDPNEAEQRLAILERLAAIEARLVALTPPQIGHNNPPESMEADTPTGAAKQVQDASKAIAIEVSKNKPDVAEVARRTTVLAGAARRLRAAGAAATGFGKQVTDKVKDKAAEIAATAAVGSGAAFHAQIGSALQSIGAWFRMLF
jgi:putative restriction endonuclease